MSNLQLNKGLIFGFICLLLPMASWAKTIETLPEVQNIDMFLGEVKMLGEVDVDRVAIGNGGVIRAEILENKELLIIAQSKGSSTLRLWNKDGTQKEYNFRISENDPEKRVRMDSMIRIKVKMVEFRKSELTRLGINWSQDLNGPTFATVGDALSSKLFRPEAASFGGQALPLKIEPFSSYFGIATTLTSRINLLASDGHATILSEPVLTCVNGGTAKFLSGGSYPIPMTGENGRVQVEFKEYGIKLEISPRANKNNEIYTTIKTEVSEIDESISVLGVPGVLSNETETIVNVLSGQTIVISGLLKSKTSEDVTRVPGLGHIPFLGGLFRSTEKRNELMELVVFLTPEVVSVNDTFDPRAERLLRIEKTGRTTVSEVLEYSMMD